MQKIFRETKSQICFRERTSLDFPAHIHDDIELVYVKKGSGIACCDGRKYQLTAGTLFLVFPNQVHHYTDFAPGEYRILTMKPSELLRYGPIFLEGEPSSAVYPLPQEDDGIVYLLEAAYRELARDGYSDIIAAYLTAFFGKLLPFYRIEKTGTVGDNVLTILQYCTNHYKEDISVDTVAEQLGLSRSCVSHIFSTRICMNFCDYVNSLRLKDAEELLQNKHYSVTEIANLAGFSTIRTFNRAFSKKYGCSPSAYRKAFIHQN